MTARMNETVTEILSDDEIATLNEARSILDAYGKRCSTASWDAPRLEAGKANAADYGRGHALAEVASDSLFRLLNWTNSHYVRSMTGEQLHNRQECRDCGEVFPYDPDADRCPTCVASILDECGPESIIPPALVPLGHEDYPEEIG